MNVTQTDVLEQQKIAELTDVLEGVPRDTQCRLLDWLRDCYCEPADE